jgi:subtilisin-like proprotein convertase family protein
LVALGAVAVAILAPGAQGDPTLSFTYSSGAALTIVDDSVANPYPSQITVSGLSGTITKITATLSGIAHDDDADIDVLLAGPAGQRVMLMSDACPQLPSNTSLTFDDGSPALLTYPGTCPGGSIFKPTNVDGGDSATEMPAPAGAPNATTMAAFSGSNPNGIWNLYVRDDSGSASGTIAGWSITLTGPVLAPAAPKKCKKGRKLKRGKCIKKKKHRK